MVEITLAWYEINVAATVGMWRYSDSVRRKKDRFFETKSKEHRCMIELNGAGAEVAVAGFLGLNWVPGVSKHGLVDVAPNIEVRQTSLKNGRLRIRQCEMESEEKRKHPYVLVRGEMPKFQIIGWLYGVECIKKGSLEDPGDNGPCYFVAEKFLTPITEAYRGKRSLTDW